MKRTVLPSLPDGRIAWRDPHREAAWMPTFQRTMNAVTALSGPGFIVGALLLGVLLVPLSFLGLAIVEAVVRRLPIQRARWDAAGLTLQGPTEGTWRWETIDELGFKKSDSYRIRFVAQGQEHWLVGPANPQRRNALLAHWRVHLTGEEQPLPARDPQWLDELGAKEARVRFWEGSASQEPAPSALRPALWVGLVLTSLAMLALALPTGGGFAGTLLAVLTVVAGFSIPMGIGTAAFFASQRQGTVRVDQHGLTLAPPDGTERRFVWDAITHLEHDELELRLTTDEGTFHYDFSRLRVDRTRGLLHELEDRWRARSAAEADEDGREAMRRLQQAAGQGP